MIIFDIGYHRGESTKPLLALYPDAKIIGVEANPKLAQEEGVLNFLVGPKSGLNVFFAITNHDSFSTASDEWIAKSRHADVFNGAKNILVPTITLDDLIKLHGQPDILKVDVEGYERLVFKGLTKHTGGTILFEFHGEIMNVAANCVRRLESLGYYDWHVQDFTVNPDEAVLTNPPFAKNIMEQLDRCTKNSWGMIYCA